MYKLICFDLDDTLWPCMPTIQQAEQTLYNWLAQHKPQITGAYTTQQLREKRMQLIRAQPALMHDLSAARRVHLKQLADEFHDSDEWVETAFSVFYEARQKVNLFDDVLPVLSALKAQYTLAALTNGNAHISKTGLDAVFDFQVSAADVQLAKPDPAMFIRAMQQASVSAAQTLHVGDHPVHDIVGARNAGIDAVWIQRFEHTSESNRNLLCDLKVQPVQHFTDLYQLQSWLSADAV